MKCLQVKNAALELWILSISLAAFLPRAPTVLILNVPARRHIWGYDISLRSYLHEPISIVVLCWRSIFEPNLQHWLGPDHAALLSYQTFLIGSAFPWKKVHGIFLSLNRNPTNGIRNSSPVIFIAFYRSQLAVRHTSPHPLISSLLNIGKIYGLSP